MSLRRMLKSLRADHTPWAVRRRLRERPSPSYLSDFIYGAVDGAVTTFAVVAGVAGAGLDEAVVTILGGANLIADGFSVRGVRGSGRAEGPVRRSRVGPIGTRDARGRGPGRHACVRCRRAAASRGLSRARHAQPAFCLARGGASPCRSRRWPGSRARWRRRAASACGERFEVEDVARERHATSRICNTTVSATATEQRPVGERAEAPERDALGAHGEAAGELGEGDRCEQDRLPGGVAGVPEQVDGDERAGRQHGAAA